jgi:hypothetical protein
MIIGLTGKKAAGKNLAADIIQAEIPATVVAAFADPLREVCKTIFGLEDDDMHDRERKEATLNRYPFESPRQILQKVGTDCIRTHYPEAWVEALKHQIRACADVVVSDVRFENEVAAIKSMGGFILRVVRPGLNSSDAHISETIMDGLQADAEVINDGSVHLFKHRVLAAYYELRER